MGKDRRKLVIDGEEFTWTVDHGVDYGGVRATIRLCAGGPILHYFLKEFPRPVEAVEVVRFATEHGWSKRRNGTRLWVLEKNGLRTIHEGPIPPEKVSTK